MVSQIGMFHRPLPQDAALKRQVTGMAAGLRKAEVRLTRSRITTCPSEVRRSLNSTLSPTCPTNVAWRHSRALGSVEVMSPRAVPKRGPFVKDRASASQRFLPVVII